MTRRSVPTTLLGIVAFAVGLVGYAVFGWRIGGAIDLIPTVLGAAVAAVAVAVTLRRFG